MGVGNTTRATYYSIFEGRVCRSFKAKTEHSVERKNKIGNVVHEEFYDYIEGKIVGINTREHKQYGKSWVIKLEMDGDTMIFQFPYSCGYAGAFLKILPNVDLAKKVRLIPDQKKDGEKKKSSMFILQGGHAVKWAFTKDNKGELPDLVQVKVKGKTQWDDSDQMEYLEQMVKDEILPLLGQKELERVDKDDDAADDAAPPAETQGSDIVNDDLPF